MYKRRNTRTLIALLSVSVLSLLFACQGDVELDSFTATEPELSFELQELPVLATENIYDIKIKANLPWRAKADNDWISVEGSTSYGDATQTKISFKVSKNPITTPRSGSITAWITPTSKCVITINQEAGTPPPVVKKHIYVKEAGTGNGESWENATSLDNALAKELDAGDFIHIAAGTYKPTVNITGGSESAANKTFEIKENIILIGGYPADATQGAVSEPSVYITELNGMNTASHVVTITATQVEGQKVEIKNLTIKGGNAAVTGKVNINGIDYATNYGGGIILGKSVAELTHCIVTANSSSSGGGAVYAFNNSTLLMDNCVVSDNKATASSANGGGIFIDSQSSFTLIHSVVSSNAAGGFAGGVYTMKSTARIINSAINGNGAGGLGSTVGGKAYGGIYIREGSSDIINCTIYGNTASNFGAGIGAYGTASAPATVNVISTTITGNQVKNASAKGSGIYVNATADNASLNIYNSIIAGNTAGTTGVESLSDIEGATGYGYAKKMSVIASAVYDSKGASVSGLMFDYATMLGGFAENGGPTKTCSLTGADNPAKTNGMSVDELVTLGNTFLPVLSAETMSMDQRGASRIGKLYIGASVK